MGGFPVNPVIQGLTTGMSIADMLHRQRIEDQQIALSRQRMSDAEQVNAGISQRADADLAMRLHTMGARPMTPSDELEANSGVAVNYAPQRVQATGPDGLPQTNTNMLPSMSPSDLKNRLVKAGGQQYVLPTAADDEARADLANQRQIKRDTAKAKAAGDAKIAEEREKINTLGVPLTDEATKLMNLPAGTKIPPEHLDDYMRAYITAKAAQIKEKPSVHNAVPMWGKNAQGVAVVKSDGTVEFNSIPQLGGKAEPPQSPNEQRLATKAATDELIQQTASKYATQYDKPEDAEAALKADSATDPFVKKQYLGILKQLRGGAPKPKSLNSLTADEAIAQLDRATGGGAPKAAAPKQYPKGKADGAKLRAFAIAKGIDYKAAVAQAEKEGFDVTGLKAK